MPADPKPYRHRFPKSIIQHAVWLYHRFTLSYRDIEELLFQRGIQVSHETIRDWCDKFGPNLTKELKKREPQRGSRWHLDEVCVKIKGVKQWLWRAVDEHGAVLDVLLQEHRDTEAAKTFFATLLITNEVPTAIHTDKLGSYSAAIRELPELHGAEHREVISTARCNNLVEQSHRPTRSQERSQKGFKSISRAQNFLDLHARTSNLHQHTRTTVTAETRRSNQKAAFQTWNEVALLAA
ncbi:Integrase catalytic region (plasmid) [Deinococcus proteolyticus MRP]|uniref:Integrase catalytic region n=1 Tax=Deinococcus proteolyticus (strain ATCC 35074 / DSM 20540 / JCM 6276 / NBRC 101906 / NCIMB 13154 / VKM Ac-1939 / CCM 2703 / MRP) TaxID=693977 RepID=F0RR75_DEIPM|nr:IS6 family transposase [Deinococcus proteolyticus]ADY27784.1 Integrase catalytic region [Deinococcus proteolyticus MRP]